METKLLMSVAAMEYTDFTSEEGYDLLQRVFKAWQ